MDTIQRINALFETKGQSNRSILLGLGFSPTALAEWNRGKAKPTVDAIIKLANYFNVSTDYLLCLSETPTPISIEQTEKAVPVERPESDIATIDDIKSLLAENNELDFIERLYQELQEKQKIFVLSWLIGYMVSEGLPVNKILGR